MASFWATAGQNSPDWQKAYFLSILARANYYVNDSHARNWGVATGALGSNRVPRTGGSVVPTLDYHWYNDVVVLSWAGCNDYRQVLDYVLGSYQVLANYGLPGSVSQFIQNMFAQVKTQIDTMLTSVAPTTKFLLAGHSLGGALAQYVGAYIKKQSIGPNRCVGVYCFGAPMIGASTFADYCGTNMFTFRADDDPVPLMPSQNAGGILNLPSGIPSERIVFLNAMFYYVSGTRFRIQEGRPPERDINRLTNLMYEQFTERNPPFSYPAMLSSHSIETYIRRLGGVILKPIRSPFDGEVVTAIDQAMNLVAFDSTASVVPMAVSSIGGLRTQQVPPPPLAQVVPASPQMNRIVTSGPRTSQAQTILRVPGRPPIPMFGLGTTPDTASNNFKGEDRRALEKLAQVLKHITVRDGYMQMPDFKTHAVSNRQYMVPPEVKKIADAFGIVYEHAKNLLAQKANHS